MENKQIIVDNVNVGGCEFCEWKGSNIPQCRIRFASFESICEGYNCYYKQLAREKQSSQEARDTSIKESNRAKVKEQECEELRSDLTDLSKTIDCKNGTILTFKEQLAQFKVKNYKYSLFIEKLCDYAGLECDSEEQAMRALSDLVSQVNKDRYRQTLIKVKEITKNMNKECFYNDFSCGGCDMINGCTYQGKLSILQKISECEAENAR